MADHTTKLSLSELTPGSASSGAPSHTNPNTRTPSASRESTNAPGGTVIEHPVLEVIPGKEKSFQLQCEMFGNRHDRPWKERQAMVDKKGFFETILSKVSSTSSVIAIDEELASKILTVLYRDQDLCERWFECMEIEGRMEAARGFVGVLNDAYARAG